MVIQGPGWHSTGRAYSVRPRVKPQQRFSGFSTSLPITSRLLDFREMLKAAIVTRFLIGLLRIEENIPTAKRKPQLSQEAKYTSFYERVFMEAFGVPFHVFNLYAFQDIFAKLFQDSFLKLPLNNLLNQNIPKPYRKTVENAMQEVYRSHKNLVARQVYGGKLASGIPLNGAFGAVKRKLVDELKDPKLAQGLDNLLVKYQRRIAFSSAGALALAVIISAYLSGYVLQWLNDNVVAKRVIPWVLKNTGVQQLPPNLPVQPAQNLPPLAERTFKV